MRNEIETKRNKRNETKRNETKSTKTKRNQRNENEIGNGRKNNRNQTYFHNYDARLDVTIEQEYYAFIQRESVLLTWWFLLNLGTIRATSSLLKGEKLK